MKYLNDRITFTLTGQTGYSSGTYVYYVYQESSHYTHDDRIIFAGNFYHDGSNTVTFDVTDIINSNGGGSKEDSLLGINTIVTTNVALYWVKVVWAAGNEVESTKEWVARVYDYNNKTLMNSNIFFNPYQLTGTTTVTLQGYKPNNGTVLIPHYPMFSDEQAQYNNKCRFLISLLISEDIIQHSDVEIDFYVGSRRFMSTGLNVIANSLTVGRYCSQIANFDDYTPTTDGSLRINNNTVAILDVCPKRYYLIWRDRYGSYQSQGFNDYANYSESFDKTEVMDYKNRRQAATVNVHSKWNISSGWIPEELYPYYESIYTSPILFLYDSMENKTHTVLVSGDYVEKTYRNQKKMISMELELEENKTQNIIY